MNTPSFDIRDVPAAAPRLGATSARAPLGARLGAKVLTGLGILCLGLAAAACSGNGKEGTGDGGPDAGPACVLPTVTPQTVDLSQRKFALTLFHFNLEYVMGGLDGDGRRFEPLCGSTCAGWDNAKVEDWILSETFAPVVDFYLEHPSWGATFEMQGYMIEVIGQRFPELLPKLRTVIGRGQIELSSFHYADQLFLAFPSEDLRRSQQLMRQVLADHCVPLSGVVFDQEGQAGAGWLSFLGEQGYRVGVFPKNLFRYQHGKDAVFWPLYEQDKALMIVGPGGVDSASGFEVTWPFFDDGELLAAAGGLAPYLAPAIEADYARLDAFAVELQALEDAGYRVSTIGHYVDSLQAAGVKARPAPPLLDGTWQAPSTDSIHRWLGGRGQAPYWAQEQDVAVRSGNLEASLLLKAAELAQTQAIAQGILVAPANNNNNNFDAAWKALFHAEVSDGSGVNPWAAEVFWSLDKSQEVKDFAGKVLGEVKAAMQAKTLAVDLANVKVEALAAPPPEDLHPASAPLPGFVVDSAGRRQTVLWQELGTGGKRFRLQIEFGPGTDPDLDRILKLSVPRTEERLRYSPGLQEDRLVDYPLSAFQLDWNEAYLPLSNGLIGLGQNWWLIKHARVQHLAARIDARVPQIEFIDEVAPLTATRWRFELVQGDAAAALAVARSINVTPVIYW